MTDEIIRELWETKDSIVRDHGYDVEALVAHLRTKERLEGQEWWILVPAEGRPNKGAPQTAKGRGSRRPFRLR